MALIQFDVLLARLQTNAECRTIGLATTRVSALDKTECPGHGPSTLWHGEFQLAGSVGYNCGSAIDLDLPQREWRFIVNRVGRKYLNEQFTTIFPSRNGWQCR